jgi:hypothetical protein
MKSFKSFLNEKFLSSPIVDIEIPSTTDVSIPEIKNQLNRNIDLTLRQSFVNIDQAITKLSKLLAMYNLDIPQIDLNDIKSDSISLVVGHHNLKWDELEGKINETNPYILKFSFKLLDGLYKCSAELE